MNHIHYGVFLKYTNQISIDFFLSCMLPGVFDKNYELETAGNQL